MPKTSPRVGNDTKDAPQSRNDVVLLEDVTISFGSFTATRNLDLRVADGEFVTVVGPTGCGKSTILNAIAGLITPASGSVLFDGKPLSGINSDVGYLFQQDTLLPWKTAIENVGLGLTLRRKDPGEARSLAADWLAKVGLKGFESRYPHQLSGGQKKRVQMAQALITGPRVILMDEPFSALDVHTRHLMQNELLRLWQESRRSVVFITHDLEEALALGDRTIVMSAGPGARFVASFDNPLPRPRNVSEIMFDRDYLDLYQQVWGSLKGEVEKSYAERF